MTTPLDIVLLRDRNDHPLQDPFSSYKISDQDSNDNPMLQYFGYLAHNGSWYIQKWNLTDQSFRYASGISGYSTAWGNRKLTLPFYTYESIFGAPYTLP